MMLLQQELREPAMYNSIINSIAYGATKLNEISTKMREESTKVNKYLQTLVNLQIISKSYPFGENPQNSRRGIYSIADNCYAFWYRFVFINKPEIESGSGDLIAKSIVSELSAYIGKPPFEKICMQYLKRINQKGKLPFTATSFGSWWGTDSQTKSQSDFDVIAANRKNKQIILAECKWSNDVDINAQFQKLTAKSHIFSEYKDKYYYIFTKNKAQTKLHNGLTHICADMLFDI